MIGHFAFNNHHIGQTMAFLTLSSTQLFHAYNVKNEHSIFSKYTFKNKFMNFAFIFGFTLQIAVIYIPGLNNVFNMAALSLTQFFICMALSLFIVLVMEISKLISRRKK